MTIDNPIVRFHRNGCCGEGFHTVSFTEGRGKNRRYLRAVVFSQPGHVAVVDQDDAAARFRGDWYEPPLRAAIAAAFEDPHTYDYDDPRQDERTPVLRLL